MSTTEGADVVDIRPPVQLRPRRGRHAGDLLEQPVEALEDSEFIGRSEYQANQRRVDQNSLLLEKAIAQLRSRPRPAGRTASSARIDPDRFWFGMLILGINAVFAAGALTASFIGQYEIAARTHLPEQLWWVVPVAIDFPIMSAAFTGAVYRRRKQGTVRTWSLMIALTVVSTVVNVTRVLDQDGYFGNGSLTFADWVGVAVMGIMPSLVLVTWENLARLLIRPLGEQDEEPALPA
jgi:hypothetical protein